MLGDIFRFAIIPLVGGLLLMLKALILYKIHKKRYLYFMGGFLIDRQLAVRKRFALGLGLTLCNSLVIMTIYWFFVRNS